MFAYIYAVLNCPSYQSRYSDFLKLDFPRVRLVPHGDNMVHNSAPRFAEINPKTGDYLEECRVYINDTQYFENVPQEVWEAEIGGYQVCFQWIKDRRGEELSYADLSHYQRLVQALYESLQIMDEIEAVAPNWSTT